MYNNICFDYNGMPISYCDFILYSFSQPMFLTMPILLLYIFFKQKIFINNKTIIAILLDSITNISLFLLIIFLTCSFVYCIKEGISAINFVWTNNGFFSQSMSPIYAICLALLFLFFRLLFISLIINLIDVMCKKDWLGMLTVFCLSYIDSTIRLIIPFNIPAGVFPSENTSVFYFFYEGIYYKAHVNYLFSTLYWIIPITIILIILNQHLKRQDSYEI